MGLKLKSTNGTGSVELNAPDNHNINTSFTLPTSNFTGGEWVLADGSGNVNIDSGTLYVDAVNDRVGVGTATPSEKLDVSGTGDIKAAIQTTSTGTGANAALRLKTGNYNWLLQTGDTVGGGLRFYDSTNSAERVRIDSSGNVGINVTPSGSAKLQVNGSFRLAGSGSASDSSSPLIYRVSGQDTLAISTSSTERMRIDSNGNLGLGTTSPYNAAGYASMTLDDTSGAQIRFRTGGTEAGLIYNEGARRKKNI